jgi:hypothetical protein
LIAVYRYLADLSSDVRDVSSLHSYPNIKQLYATLNTDLPVSAVVDRAPLSAAECAHFDISGEARGFKVGGGKGEGTGGGGPPPGGGPGAVPPEKFSNYRCTSVSFSAF